MSNTLPILDNYAHLNRELVIGMIRGHSSLPDGTLVIMPLNCCSIDTPNAAYTAVIDKVGVNMPLTDYLAGFPTEPVVIPDEIKRIVGITI